MRKNFKCGCHSLVSENASIGDNVVVGCNCIIEDGVSIGDDTYIDSNTIIRTGTTIGGHGFIGANCILGEYQMDFIHDRLPHPHELSIGSDAVIRSGSILYTGSKMGRHFQTGHQVTIRENTAIGNYVSFGTLSDIQGDCCIGDYVRAHSNVHIAQRTTVESFVWMFPDVTFTNDPTPPSEVLSGGYVCSFAVIASRAIILPGKKIGQDALVSVGSVVTKDVAPYTLVSGNPAKKISDVRQLNKIAGREVYPWRESFSRGMPWAEDGFARWYQQLSSAEKEHYNIDALEN